MESRLNQIKEQSAYLSAFDKIENLSIEGLEIQDLISDLEKQLNPQSSILSYIDDLRRNLQSLTSSYENLCVELHEKLTSERETGDKLVKTYEERKETEQTHTDFKRKKLVSKETLIQDKERELETSLRKIHDLWDGNIREMEISVEQQRQILQRMDFEHRSQLEEMELEIQQTLEEPLKHSKPGEILITQVTDTKSSTSGHQNSSEIILDQLITESDQEPPLEESLQSIESLQMLNTNTEPVNKSVKMKKLGLGDIKMGPVLNLQSVNNSYLTDSHASSVFDRLIDEAEEQSNKDKLPDGWNPDIESENESFSIENRSEEIRNALKILKKFNLLNPQKVLRLAEIMNSPEKSSNLELILQIMNIQSNKKRKHRSPRLINPHLSSSGKPPTPTDKLNWKKQLSIQGSQEPPPQDLACTTPKNAFLFPEESEYNRTITSSDNLTSSRKKNKFRRFDCESEQDLHQLQE